MRTRTVSGLAGALVLLAACTFGSPDPDPAATPEPAYRATECPELVARSIIGEVECGRLSVPESRSVPDGRRIAVHVTRVRPPGLGVSDSAGAPLLTFTGVGQRPNYGAIGPLAQRTGREVLIVDGRGVGHSEPALECPEVEGALSLTQSAEDERADYLAGVKACRSRLEAGGVDVGAFNLSEAAGDLADLRKALDIDSWDLISYSTASRVAVELLRVDAGGVGAVVLDSPELPGMDPRQIAATRTERVVRQLLDECADDPRCARRFPNAPDLYDAAFQALAKPLELSATAPGGGTRSVRLDLPLLVRVLRAMTSDQGSSGASLSIPMLPLTLEHVAGREREWLERELGAVLLTQEPFCLGHAPQCLGRHHVSIGVWLTTYCRDVLPFTRPSPQAERHPTTGRLDEGVCALWDVGEADVEVSRPPSWTGPALVVVGRWATYAPSTEVREVLAGWPNVSLVTDPTGGHNVLPHLECTLSLRNEWLAEPRPTATPDCLRTARITWTLR